MTIERFIVALYVRVTYHQAHVEGRGLVPHLTHGHLLSQGVVGVQDDLFVSAGEFSRPWGRDSEMVSV